MNLEKKTRMIEIIFYGIKESNKTTASGHRSGGFLLNVQQ
jgi:hypothetical protein